MLTQLLALGSFPLTGALRTACGARPPGRRATRRQAQRRSLSSAARSRPSTPRPSASSTGAYLVRGGCGGMMDALLSGKWTRDNGVGSKVLPPHATPWFPSCSNTELALEWLEPQRAVMQDPTKAGWFLQYQSGNPQGAPAGAIYNEDAGGCVSAPVVGVYVHDATCPRSKPACVQPCERLPPVLLELLQPRRCCVRSLDVGTRPARHRQPLRRRDVSRRLAGWWPLP